MDRLCILLSILICQQVHAADLTDKKFDAVLALAKQLVSQIDVQRCSGLPVSVTQIVDHPHPVYQVLVSGKGKYCFDELKKLNRRTKNHGLIFVFDESNTLPSNASGGAPPEEPDLVWNRAHLLLSSLYQQNCKAVPISIHRISDDPELEFYQVLVDGLGEGCFEAIKQLNRKAKNLGFIFVIDGLARPVAS